MENLNLWDAFAKLGGKAENRLHSVSAMSQDGAMILSCATERFGHPAQGVLRYEDRLSRDASRPVETRSLGEHLTLARDGSLPVKMIVITSKAAAVVGKTTRSFHVRTDLVGRVVEFDGDHFVVDFVRLEDPRARPPKSAKRA